MYSSSCCWAIVPKKPESPLSSATVVVASGLGLLASCLLHSSARSLHCGGVTSSRCLVRSTTWLRLRSLLRLRRKSLALRVLPGGIRALDGSQPDRLSRELGFPGQEPKPEEEQLRL